PAQRPADQGRRRATGRRSLANFGAEQPLELRRFAALVEINRDRFPIVHGPPQFCLIFDPFITMSLSALTLILPLPSIVMSLPLIVIVPSFFIEMLASPLLITRSSPASIRSFFATVRESSFPTLTSRFPVISRSSS